MNARPFQLTDDERLRIERIDLLVAIGASSVPELVRALSDASWTVRRAAVAALGAFGDAAVPALVTRLSVDRTSEHTIAAAVDALAGALGEAATPAVAALLDHENPAVVADAAQILGRRHASDTVSALTAALSHPDANVVVSAIEALGRIGSSAAIEPLIALMRTREFFRAFAALQVLSRASDPRAIAPIAELLSDDTFRFEAIHALGRSGSAQALRPLAAIMRNADRPTTIAIALAVAELTERATWIGAEEAVRTELIVTFAPLRAHFLAALPGAAAAERRALAALLGRIGDASTIPTLLTLARDPDVGLDARRAIVELGAAHQDELVDALADDDARIRVAILPAIRAAGAAPAVRGLLADPDPEVRARACETLARLGDVVSVSSLFDALGDHSPRVAHAATSAIQSLGTVETVPRALVALAGPRLDVRRHALRILAYLGPREAFQPVLAAIRDGADARSCELAVGALAAIDDPRVDTELARLARDPRDEIRAAVMRAAAARSAPALVPVLEAALADDSAWVRYYACQGIGRMTPAGAIPAVTARLADPAPHVRIAAIEALAHLDSDTAREVLRVAARGSDPDERRAALIGIGHQRDAAAQELLVEAMRSDDLATRLVALAGLAALDDERAIAAIAKAVRSADEALRDAALSILAERADPAAAGALVDAAVELGIDHPASAALSRRGTARIAAIVAKLRDADDTSATLLASALGRMRVAPATSALFAGLASANAAARRACATILVAIDAPGARPAVAQLARDDSDLDVRRACAAALAP